MSFVKLIFSPTYVPPFFFTSAISVHHQVFVFLVKKVTIRNRTTCEWIMMKGKMNCPNRLSVTSQHCVYFLIFQQSVFLLLLSLLQALTLGLVVRHCSSPCSPGSPVILPHTFSLLTFLFFIQEEGSSPKML